MPTGGNRTQTIRIQRVTILLVVLMLGTSEVGSMLRAAPPTIPSVGRPSRDFYNGIASPAVLSWVVSPKVVAVGDPIGVELIVRNVLNGPQIIRPDLRKLPDFADAFQIDDVADDPIPPGVVNERIFRYTLRPRSEEVTEVPEFRFAYFDPSLKGKATNPAQAFRVAYADPVPLTIKPPPPPPESAVPTLPQAAWLQTPLAASEIPQSSPIWLGWLLAPLVGFGWWLCDRWRNPSAVRLARRRRSRAAWLAVRAIPRLDSVIAIEREIRRYLVQRLDLPESATTLPEMLPELQRRNWSDAAIRAVEQWLNAVDALRFAPESPLSDRAFRDQSIALIETIEGASE
ncbi:BatD family protein [Tuwongella immobilis]|uniref:Protein BatD n=1 Tax=Tuwongella immobilis TaxID=692036 RepID=A0A6C2YJX2_9BACT|nr:protein BatD [Tuwongella immobilis]VIP01880.1 Uncharacterized protein OS=Candidatus Entotheonella sp. TSY1 GN=ETSY1_32180 PE=4 SV=1 [Tuwongella immobilis]VTR99728.1 Uncharacterized protein OS=Candidatus Entotheonella sp. TSY1 GN=ETSY1_32180 PE=4 SV=1 [Tuwongella immobilis]